MNTCPISWGKYDQMLDSQSQEDLDNPNIEYDVRVTERMNEMNQLVRKIQLVKITKIVEKRIPRSVLERRQRLKPFGLASKTEENSQITMISQDQINIIPNKKIVKQKVPKPTDGIVISDGTIKCRKCGANHWTSRCNNPPSMFLEEDGERIADVTSYVPPNRRLGMNLGQMDEDNCKIRITNLPENTTQEDVENLVSQVARARRVNLVRDRHTGESRGFAFVTFSIPDDVERAIQILNGHRYSHMILSVEKARMRRN